MRNYVIKNKAFLWLILTKNSLISRLPKIPPSNKKHSFKYFFGLLHKSKHTKPINLIIITHKKMRLWPASDHNFSMHHLLNQTLIKKWLVDSIPTSQIGHNIEGISKTFRDIFSLVGNLSMNIYIKKHSR